MCKTTQVNTLKKENLPMYKTIQSQTYNLSPNANITETNTVKN